MTLADTLSRLPSTENPDTIDQDITVDLVRFRSERLNEIRKETKADLVLDQLQGMITTGWPDSIKDLPPVIRSYWPYRDEISVNDGIIMKGSRIIIPETQQKLSWTSYITAIKVLKKHVKPEMLYTGSDLIQIPRT